MSCIIDLKMEVVLKPQCQDFLTQVTERNKIQALEKGFNDTFLEEEQTILYFTKHLFSGKGQCF